MLVHHLPVVLNAALLQRVLQGGGGGGPQQTLLVSKITRCVRCRAMLKLISVFQLHLTVIMAHITEQDFALAAEDLVFHAMHKINRVQYFPSILITACLQLFLTSIRLHAVLIYRLQTKRTTA
jgi:hypothetical protein